MPKTQAFTRLTCVNCGSRTLHLWSKILKNTLP